VLDFELEEVLLLELELVEEVLLPLVLGFELGEVLLLFVLELELVEEVLLFVLEFELVEEVLLVLGFGIFFAAFTKSLLLGPVNSLTCPPLPSLVLPVEIALFPVS
jgi:hypothetical protein